MERKTSLCLTACAALGLGLVLAGPSAAQDPSPQTRARTVTQSLNAGPADSTLGSRPATTPLPQSRPAPAAVRVAPSPTRDPVAELLGRIETGSPSAPAAPANGSAETRVAAVPAGPTSALPPLPIGYYVRGDKDCNQVWPLAGDLAWLSELTFSIDFGGCEPGAIERTGATTWSERQTCQTELGGEGPPYIIDYEAAADGVLLTRARLGEIGRAHV